MVSKAGRWLRSMLRAGKRQQRSVARLASRPVRKAKALPRPKPKSESVPKRAAPGRAGAAGKWLAAYATGGLPPRRLAYWLFVPELAAVPAAGMPLLVMLHGCEQGAAGFAEGTRMNARAGRLGYAVLYPQQGLAGHPRRCWNWFERAALQGGGEVPLIAAAIAKVATAYPIDPARVYICGLSAGAAMAHLVALHHPGLFAGVGLHSGPVFGAARNAVGALGVMQHGAAGQADGAIAALLARQPGFPGLPAILIQGEDDRVVRPVNADQLRRQCLLANGLAPSSAARVLHKPPTSRTRAYTVRDVLRGRQLLVREVRIAGLGHAWSGGDARLPFQGDGGPDASGLLLDFFARHRRRPGPAK